MKQMLSLLLLSTLLVPTIAGAQQMKMENFGTIESRGGQMTTNVGTVAETLQGKPLVVRVHADWCGACKASQSALDQALSQFKGKINFVAFDVTNSKTSANAQAQAQRLGLSKFYDATKAATSTVAVIDPKTGNVVAELYADDNVADYVNAIQKAEKGAMAADKMMH